MRAYQWALAIDPALRTGWALTAPHLAIDRFVDAPQEILNSSILGKRTKILGVMDFGDYPVIYGTYDCRPVTKTKTRKGDPPHARIFYLRAWVRAMLNTAAPEESLVLAVERSSVHRGMKAIESSHKLRAAIEMVDMEIPQVDLRYTDQNDVKYHATRTRSAKKPEMIQAAAELYGYTGEDEDVADALHILGWYYEYRGTLT